MCVVLQVFFDKTIDDSFSSELEMGFAAAAKEIKLSKKLSGYFLPTKCYSYCNSTKIIWFDNGRFYLISSKSTQETQENIDDLKKSVELYLSNPLLGKKK